QALAAKGFSPGEIDGEFGPETEAAAVAFQLSEGLVVDGQVGRDTATALGISLTGEKPPEVAQPGEKPSEGTKPTDKPSGVVRPPEPIIRPIIPSVIPSVIPGVIPSVIPSVISKIVPNVLLGVGAVNPFIALAGAVLPDILKAVVGDKAGTVAGAVTQAVSQITQTQDPEEA